MQNKIIKELHRFNQRKLHKGELVLLAFAVANSLPLMEAEGTDAKGFVLGHGVLIERVVFRLNEFAHIDSDQRRELMDIVARFVLWRKAVAYGFKPLFNGEQDMVIDNLSGITKFVDMSTMCPITDHLDNANWLSCVFYDLVKFEKETLQNERAVSKEEV